MNEARRRPLGQFQLKHVLGLLTVTAVALMIVAPWFRGLDAQTQLVASIKTLTVLIAVIGIAAFLMVRQRRVDQQAGSVLVRYERLSSRILSWLVALGLWAGYAASIWSQQRTHGSSYLAYFDIPPGSPPILFFAVNYTVARLWWRIDPRGIEVRQQGLVLGAFSFYPWDAITRYTWSGQSRHQLNLFVKRNGTAGVSNLKLNADFAHRLEPILAEKIGQRTEGTPSTPVESV